MTALYSNPKPQGNQVMSIQHDITYWGILCIDIGLIIHHFTMNTRNTITLVILNVIVKFSNRGLCSVSFKRIISLEVIIFLTYGNSACKIHVLGV